MAVGGSGQWSVVVLWVFPFMARWLIQAVTGNLSGFALKSCEGIYVLGVGGLDTVGVAT